MSAQDLDIGRKVPSTITPQNMSSETGKVVEVFHILRLSFHFYSFKL